MRFDPAWFTSGVTASFGATPITGTPVELYEPLDAGAWIGVKVDTVCSTDEQDVP